MAEPNKEGTGQKKVGPITATIFIAVALITFTSFITQDDNTSGYSTPEGKLAAIDFGSLDVPPSFVELYAPVLVSLTEKCSESKARIGDFAVVGVESLKKKNVSMTILDFLKSMDGSIPGNMSDDTIRCAEIAVVLVTPEPVALPIHHSRIKPPGRP